MNSINNADSYLLHFWNDNGNVAICTVVFSTPEQAMQWGADNLREQFPGATIRETERGVSVWTAGDEVLGWKLLKATCASPDTDVSKFGTGHYESVR